MKRFILFFIIVSSFAFAGGKKCFGIIPDKNAPYGFIPFKRKCGKELTIYDLHTKKNLYSIESDGDVYDFKTQKNLYNIESDGDVYDFKTQKNLYNIDKDGSVYNFTTKKYIYNIEY